MVRNIASLSIKFFGAFVSYLLTIYLSREYGNEKLGYFSFLLSYILIFLLLLKLGTDIYLMKWTSRYYASGESGKAKCLYLKLLSYHGITGLVLTAAVACLTPWLIHRFFSNYTDPVYFQIGIISMFFINLHILNYEFLRGTSRILSYTFYNTVSVFLFTIILNLLTDFLSIHLEHRFVWCYLAAVILSFCISFTEVLGKLNKEQTTSIENLRINNILKDSMPFFSYNTVLVLIGTFDIFILSRYVQPEAIGEYALMLKLAAFISFPLTVMGANFAPKIAGFGSKIDMSKEILRTGKIIFFIAVLVFIAIFLLFPVITQFLTIQSKNGLFIFILIGIGYLVSSIFALNETCLLMMGEEKLYQKIMLCACIVNLILNLLLIPILKETGAALASMITMAVWNITAAYFTRKKLQLPTGIINKI